MPYIAFILGSMLIQAIVAGDAFLTPVFEPFEEPQSGFFDVLASIIASIFGAAVLILELLAFSVLEDVPGFIRVPLAALNVIALTLSVVYIIRGN